MKRLWLILLAAALLAQTKLETARIDALAERMRAERGMPGLAVGVVTRDHTYVKGFGVKSLATKAPVTAHTLFAVGSLTKSFTALGAALLVDEGKLEWDKPVREYLPWFEMFDPQATALVTVRDLLSHRSGLPRYDLLRYAVPLERAELVRRLQFLPPTAAIRERYQYCNLAYVAAGYLTGERAGMSWEDLMEKRIFLPLGMTGSTVRVTEMRKRPDFASPHERKGAAPQPVEFYDYQHFGVGPNGAVNAPAEDMVKYLRFHLGDGSVNGRRVVSRRQLDELHTPVIATGGGLYYALGWSGFYAAGGETLSHSGSITGFRAYMTLLPARGEGIVVLTNGPVEPAPVAVAIAREVLGWDLRGVAFPREREGERQELIAEPAAGLASRPLAAYAGRYAHPAFGVVHVAEENGGLELRFPALEIALRHLRFDVFTGERETVAQFVMDTRGQFAELRLKVDPVAPALTFKRLP